MQRASGPYNSRSVRQSVTISISALWLRAASVTSRETHRLDRRRPSFRVRIQLIGIRSTDEDLSDEIVSKSRVRWVSGVIPALSASPLQPTPRHSAFDTQPVRRYASFTPISPPFQPSLAASRLDFRASAADLNMGLATSTAGILVVLDSATTVGVRHRLPIAAKRLGHHRICGVESRVLPNVLAHPSTRNSIAPVAGQWPSVSPSRRAIAHVCGRRMSYRGYARAKRILRAVLIRSTNVEVREYVADGQGVPHGRSVCADFSNSPSHCVFGAIATIGSGEEMESESGNLESVSLAISATMVPGLRSGISVLFPSVRACRTRGFSIRPKGMRHVIASSVVDVVGEQQERGMSISGRKIFLIVFVSSAQLCLRARDVIQLGRSRVYAETVDELGEYFGSSNRRGCFHFEDVLQSQRLATFEYGFGIEIRVLRWGLRKRRCDYRSVSYCVNAVRFKS
ncbi:hypothetical protein EDB83DRAFT_2327356 [Lactarius deliciosus]|nr:hypothetical protein EDB83DRAFT_2327356 [Lactarius deliciosus]